MKLGSGEGDALDEVERRQEEELLNGMSACRSPRDRAPRSRGDLGFGAETYGIDRGLTRASRLLPLSIGLAIVITVAKATRAVPTATRFAGLVRVSARAIPTA